MKDSSQIIDRAHALLVLADTPEKVQGPVPSEYELAELYEHTLSSSRREQVLSYIAHDTDVYQQWVALIEARELLVPHSSSFTWQSVQAWCGKHSSALLDIVRLRPCVGLAVSSAFIMVTWLVMSGSSISDIDKLYADYGKQWQVTNGEPPYLATRGSQWLTLSDNQRLALYEGLNRGANQLGDTYQLSLAKPVVEGAAIELESLLSDLGYVSTLVYFKCQQPSSSAFYNDTQTIVTNIQQQLALSEDNTLSAIGQMHTPTESAKEHVCRMANWSVQQFSISE